MFAHLCKQTAAIIEGVKSVRFEEPPGYCCGGLHLVVFLGLACVSLWRLVAAQVQTLLFVELSATLGDGTQMQATAFAKTSLFACFPSAGDGTTVFS
jgi:hypothetical protein